MASGETLVGIIGDCEESLVAALTYITGVVLVISAGARTVTDRDDDHCVGRDGRRVGGEVIESGDVIRVGVEESGDGGRSVVERRL